MTNVDEDKVIAFKSQKAFESWLARNHAKVGGIWLRIYKKASGEQTVTYAEALDVALCHGWIDGLKRTYDEVSFIQRFTPRRSRSAWSKVNVGHIERLAREGRMQPPGLAAVEAAKRDGRWARAYDSPKNAKVPDDFVKELKKDKAAYAFFQTLNRLNQFAIAYRLGSAKKPETRERRKRLFLEMMAKGQKIV
ncbi:MAG TPA: YdeI/OmpD-associated family protein [Gemmatimonadaceae bacterium]